MIYVKLFTRQDCHLCDQVKADLDSLRKEYPHELVEIDIDTNADLQKKYALEIPVVEIGPYTLKAPISPLELQTTLGAAIDRQRHIERIDASTAVNPARFGDKWTDSDGISFWLSHHYIALINLFVIIYLGLPFLAPVLMHEGISGPANLIYRSYSLVCHQLAYRSFFLFGEQLVYPRAAAGVSGLLTFSQATGLSEGNSASEIFAAQRYIGDNRTGYKVAYCERDVAIYAGILLFGFVFALTGRRLPVLPWYLWLAIAIVPIGLDGFSQLLSQPPISLFPYRESTPFLRVLTGGLFGFFTAWFGYPLVEESMAETRKFLESKRHFLSEVKTGHALSPDR
jgi:uncharacterized membrane protein